MRCDCGRSTHKLSAEKCRLCLRDDIAGRSARILASLGMTGLTESVDCICGRACLTPRRARSALATLVAEGKAARVGDRYFPRSWLP